MKAATKTITDLGIITVREKLMPDTGPTLKIVADADAGTCNARQGYQSGGGMTMRLGAGCPEWTVVHEFLHSAGLAHEQGRSDRTTYMTVNLSNIKPSKLTNYAKWKAGNYYNPLYDLCSVMHYSKTIPNDWSVDVMGGVWMTLTNNGTTALRTCSAALPGTCGSQAPGQRCAISRGDKATLDVMY